MIHLGFALAHDQTSAGKCTPLVSWGPCLSVISCRMPIPESTSGILFFPELQVRGQRCLKYYMFHLGIRHKVQAVFFYMWHYIGCFLCMFCKTFRILIPCCLYLMLFLACHSSLCPLHLVLTLPVFLHALMNGLAYLVPFLLDPPPWETKMLWLCRCSVCFCPLSLLPPLTVSPLPSCVVALVLRASLLSVNTLVPVQMFGVVR